MSIDLTRTADVVIIGAGVIGLTIARALRKRGVREVTLIERGRPGAEASWAAGGILAPQVEADHADAFFRLACASRDLYPRLPNLFKKKLASVLSSIPQALCVLASRRRREKNCGSVMNGRRVKAYKLNG